MDGEKAWPEVGMLYGLIVFVEEKIPIYIYTYMHVYKHTGSY